MTLLLGAAALADRLISSWSSFVLADCGMALRLRQLISFSYSIGLAVAGLMTLCCCHELGLGLFWYMGLTPGAVHPHVGEVCNNPADTLLVIGQLYG